MRDFRIHGYRVDSKVISISFSDHIRTYVDLSILSIVRVRALMSPFTLYCNTYTKNKINFSSVIALAHFKNTNKEKKNIYIFFVLFHVFLREFSGPVNFSIQFALVSLSLCSTKI